MTLVESPLADIETIVFMAKFHSKRPTLRLELLETRTLLAGDVGAISGSGDFVTNYDPEVVDSVLTIAGKDGGELVIDSALLSDAVKTLKIAGFSNVKITGSDKFQEIFIWDVGTFTGEKIDVNGTLKTSNVDSLKLNSIAGIAWLSGNQMRLEVVDAGSVTIMSALSSLTLSTKNGVSLLGSPERGEQEVRLEFRLADADIPASMKVFQPDAPSTPTTPQQPPAYLVIVIVSDASSAGTNTLLVRLQNALREGDSASIKQAFAEYVKSIQTSQQPANASTSFATDARIFDHTLTESLLLSKTPADRPNEQATAQALRPPVLGAVSKDSVPDFAVVEPSQLAGSFEGSTVSSGLVAGSKDLRSTTLVTGAATKPPDATNTDADGASHANPHLVIESIRSTLAGLVSNLESSVNTVSAYIVSRVGNDLEPGVLPGLLVEPRSSRARRDSVEWIEV